MSVTNQTSTPPEAAVEGVSGTSPFRQFVSDYATSKLAVIAFFVLVFIVLTAVFGPFLTLQNPYDLAQVSVDGCLLRILVQRAGVGSTDLRGADGVAGQQIVNADGVATFKRVASGFYLMIAFCAEQRFIQGVYQVGFDGIFNYRIALFVDVV